MKDVFLGHLAVTVNKPVEEIAKLLYKKGENDELTDDPVDNAAELLAEWDKERVNRLRSGNPDKKALEDQYKRGKKEALESLESALKTQYNVDSDKTGAELVADIVATAAKSDLPEDKVKRHALYLDLERRLKADIDTLTKQHEAEKGQIEGDYRRKFTLADVRQIALNELDKMNPVLPENANIAANYKSLFANSFSEYDYEKQENGQYLVLKGDKRYEDGHGNPVDLQKLIKENAANFFTFKEGSEKGSAGNKNGVGSSGSGTVPKNEVELWEMYNKATTQEERKGVLEAFEKQNGAITV